MRHRLAGLLAALALGAPAWVPAWASAPMQLPAPIELASFTDSVKVSKAILAACGKRHWLAQSDDGHSITAEYDVRTHKAVIRIDYSPREIRFAYVDSENLDYEVVEGVPHIHGKFNQWVSKLGYEVAIQAQMVALERDTPDVVEAPAKPADSIADLRQPDVVLKEAPSPPVAAAPPQAGQTATLSRPAPLYGRPSAGAAQVQLLKAGARVSLRSRVNGEGGGWWYVDAPGGSGWLREADLAP